MQGYTRKIDLESRPLSRSASLKAVKSDPNQNKVQKIFRLSFTNFKIKKQVEADILSGVLQINNRDKIAQDAQLQSQPEPNIIRMEKFFQPNRKELKRFSAIVSNAQPVRVTRYQTGESNAQNEAGFDTQPKQFKKFTPKRPLTQSSSQRGTVRLPSADMIRAPSRAGNGKEFYQVAQYPLTINKSSEKMTVAINDERVMSQGHFYVDLPGFDIEGFDTPQISKETDKFQSKRNSVSDSVAKGGRINYSTSVSSHNTHQDINCASGHIEDDKKISSHNNRQAREELSKEDLSNKQSKMIEKIIGAKFTAQLINDQVIRQSQFLQNDEEEEANFKELCNALNSHW